MAGNTSSHAQSSRTRAVSSVTLATSISLVALVAFTAYRHFAMLDATPYAVGVDGYFYPIQLRSILEHGTLAYPDFPLAFYLMAPFAAATNPIVGAKLGAVILGALAILPAYGIGARLSKSRGAGFIAAVLVATSAGSSFLAFEFIKNGIGVTMALLAVWLGLRACELEGGAKGSDPFAPGAPVHSLRGRIVVAMIAVVAAIATHKVAGALVLVVAAPAAVAAASERGKLFGRRLLYAVTALVGISIAGLVAAGAHGLVARIITTDANLEAPALVSGDQTLLPMGHEGLAALILAVLAAVALLTKRVELSRPARAAAWGLVVLGVIIGQPWLAVDDPQGLGFRLRVIAFVPMSLCAAIVAGAVPKFRAIILGAISVAILALMPARRTQGMVVPHPAMVTSVLALTNQIPRLATVIIPERQLVFMAAYYTRLPIRLEPDEVPPPLRYRAVTLAFIQAFCPIESALDRARARPFAQPPRGLHPSAENGFVLMDETTWRWVIDQLPTKQHDRCAAWPTI